MMGLIVSPNLLEIYVFWELVGMCSYLLVGFGMTGMALHTLHKKHLLLIEWEILDYYWDSWFILGNK